VIIIEGIEIKRMILEVKILLKAVKVGAGVGAIVEEEEEGEEEGIDTAVVTGDTDITTGMIVSAGKEKIEENKV